VNGAKLSQIQIPLASVNQQKKIAEKLDELFSDLDAGVAALQRAKANLKRYRASVLKAAVEGKLTAQWREQNPPTETGAQLLARILKERRAKWEENQFKKFAEQGKTPPKNWQDKYREPIIPEISGLPDLPKGWVWMSIDHLAFPIDHSIKAGPFGSALKKEFYASSGYKIYGQEQVIRSDQSYGNYYIDEKKYLELESCATKPGDLLISLVGTIGRTLILPDDAKLGIINPRLIKVTLDQGVIFPKFLQMYLTSPSVMAIFKLVSHGGTMEILNLHTIKSLAYPVAPINEQREIVSEISRRLSITDATEKNLDHALARAARLRQAILKRAFEGRLVPQDPNDEPASALLERIRAGRDKQTKPAKKNRSMVST